MTEPQAPPAEKPPREPAALLFLFGRALFRGLYWLLGRLQVTGREHVPPTGGVLIIANHTSYADPPLVGAAFPRPVHFMAKAELFFFPLGPIIRRTHAFPVRRGAGNRDALRRAISLLKDGKVLLIFPEGTRSPTGKLIPFEQGAAFVALSSGAHVVPMGLDGADRVLPPHHVCPRFARLRVRIGPPVDLSDLRGPRLTRELLQTATDRMAEAVAALLPLERHAHCPATDLDR